MKQFIDLQPSKWKEVYEMCLRVELPIDEEAYRNSFIEKLTAYFVSKDFDQKYATYIATTLYDSFDEKMRNSFYTSEEEEEAALSLLDIKMLKEKLAHEPSPEVRQLLVAYLVYARANPHHSNWIKNDKKVINYLASIQKLKVSDQILLTNRLHNLYNLDMRVVGSNQPIPCFRISWQAEQPAIDTEENPLVLIGPLSPATIKSFAENIPYIEEEENTDGK